MIGGRFVASEQYLEARKAGHFKGRARRFPCLDGVELLTAAEMRQSLHLRTFSDLTPFSIDGVPKIGELPVIAGLLSAVETIPEEEMQVELAVELQEIALASAVPDGAPLPEDIFNWAASPTLQKLYRVGSAAPVSLGTLDSPGRVAAVLDRRLRLGFPLGMENDIINGNGLWPGILQMPTSATGDATHCAAVVHSSNYRADALALAVAAVQTNGWHGPLQVLIHPTTRAAIFTERSATSGDPVTADAMLWDVINAWMPSKFMPLGTAIVGDFFNAIAFFVRGGVEAGISSEHLNLFIRGLVDLMLYTRGYSWVRQAGALAVVSGLAAATTNNSFAETATPLLAGATVNGLSRNGSGFSRFRAFAASDQAGTLNIQQSRDGATWYTTTTTGVAGGSVGTVLESIIALTFMRCQYVNGATNQGTFELDSSLVP
ncbi:MAG: hypothetical protein QOK39_102 [Acidimicrobiaceae bacterium]|jgi:hypothetical protein|nr:hypothetical protein [Acidimicrobiaceae bacterium]